MIKDSGGSTYDLSSLKDAVDGMGTTYATKTELEAVSADVEECFQSVSNGKALVASAITDKGVETAADATFQQMADNISSLEVFPGIVSHEVSQIEFQASISSFDVSDYLIVATYLGNPSNAGFVILVPYNIIVKCARYGGEHTLTIATSTYNLVYDYSGSKVSYDPNSKTLKSNDTLYLLLAK